MCVAGIAHIFANKIHLVIIINKHAHIATLIAQRLKATQVLIAPVHVIACSDSDLALTVIQVVDVEKHDILARVSIMHDLGALNDSVRTQIPGLLLCEGATFVVPLDKVRAAVAIDIVETRPVRFVFAVPVEC
jgi:hypothetical protein